MIFDIKKYPDPVLRKKCEDFDKIGEEEKVLAKNMLETMYENNGVGLAAPQVGILRKIIAIDIGQGPIVLFNPQIIKKFGRTKSEEGCLSIPGVILKVKRAQKVEVEGLDQNSRKVKIETEGYLSYALQHEIDHLNGVLILDRTGIWGKLKSKKILNNKNKKYKEKI